MKKRLTSIALTLALVCALVLPASAAGKFSDVASDAYYAEAVNWAVEKGITSGTSATTFSPNSTCTVAQILAFLYRANGSPQVDIPNPFIDVSSSDYYYNAALWAYQKGLVSGSVFGPNAPCTRSMVVTYLWKLEGSPYAAPAEVPTVSSLNYAPYTLSGRGEYEVYGYKNSDEVNQNLDFTIQFDAAITSKTSITLHQDMGDGGYIERDWENPTTYDVTLIAVRPNSIYTIRGGFWEFNWVDDGMYWREGKIPGSAFFLDRDGSFRYTVIGIEHFDSLFALSDDKLSWYRTHGHEEYEQGNNYSSDCGELVKLDGAYYFITYADSAIAAGLLQTGNSFSDVASSASYAQAVAWAVDKGITSGTSKTTFSPDGVCTRGQIVTFLYRAFGK